MESWAVSDPFCAYMSKVSRHEIGKTVNSHGFISTPELKIKKEKNTIRLVFLGESSTAGTGVNLHDTATWPWRTAQKLKKVAVGNVKIEFINAALGGYTSFESYGKLWSRLIHYEPDIVIVNHGWNDMYYFDYADSPFAWRNKFDFKKSGKFTLISPHWIDPWIRWSQLLSKIRFWYSSSRERGEISVSKSILKNNFNSKGVEVFKNNIRFIRDLCSARKIELFVCKQPTLISKYTSENDKKRCRYEFHGFDHHAHIQAFGSLYQVLEAENLNQIDLTSLSGKSENFYDHIHPTELGADQIAEIVADTLLRKSTYFKNN